MPTHPSMSGKTTPLYVVCSPCRCVGKTLFARLLTEFYVVNNRPVAAFDLADEGPQLADYLPKVTTIIDISDTRGQMALFDRLISPRKPPQSSLMLATARSRTSSLSCKG